MRCPIFIFIIYFAQVYCDCKNTVVVTDYGPKNCDASIKEFYVEDKDSCIANCVQRQGKDEYCYEVDCAPGLICDENFVCVVDEDVPCFKWQYENVKWKPECLPDGSFAPKQCKGESKNGRCYCYDVDGTRIFGEEWSNKAKNMTCACSRHRAALEKQNRTDVTLHCDSMGNYEPLQCDSGACWCAEPQTGKVIDSVVPEEMITILPCYNRTQIGGQYLRKCESQAYAHAKIKEEFLTHGTTFINLPFLLCDWDGSYGRYRVEKEFVYCVWRDNTNIGGWYATKNELKYTNCNCARDSKIYELAGKKLMKSCKGNGNYETLQQFDEEKNYCVDSDGFITLGPLKDLKVEDCPKEYP